MTMFEIVSGTVAFVGFALASWATYHNPKGAVHPPGRRPWGQGVISSGPYRWLRHPMYIGNWMLIAGFAGMAAGPLNAIAVGLLAELLMREWAMRDNNGRGL